MKKIILIVIFLISSIIIYTVLRFILKPVIPNTDFRNVFWDMTIEKVKEREKPKICLAETSDKSFFKFLIYKGNIKELDKELNKDCLIYYNFFENSNKSYKLYSGEYVIIYTKLPTDSTYSYLDDFNKIKEVLIKKYDSPTKEDCGVVSPLYLSSPDGDDIISPLLPNDCSVFKWKTDKAKIYLILQKGYRNFFEEKILIRIQYNKKYEELFEYEYKDKSGKIIRKKFYE